MRWLSRKTTLKKVIGLRCCSFSHWKGEVSVYRSLSHNPFENLAFEDWLYLNADLTNKRILFLWRNEPTIVIGRHQNPWAECCVKRVQESNVLLARRKSGGGTVYHDLGNVNFSFFTPRKLYNRKENLALIVEVLRERWKLDVEASSRDDILIDGTFKISGSSSKLGHAVAYHHCTLLLNVNEELLKYLLQPSYAHISSKATQSKRSSVMNLSIKDQAIGYYSVTDAISQQFCQKYAPGEGFKLLEIHPSNEKQFHGITALKKELQEWQWIYGKTPRFSVTFSTNFSSENITSVRMMSYHGLLENIEIHCDDKEIRELFTNLVGGLKGARFESGDIERALENYINKTSLTALDRNLCYRFMEWLVSVL
ncbi:lipoyl amidotransferase LIPT1, mitochondrial-like isoform X3 [Montipora capricornis]|uniref:lipoyl amidotransferase LIPT1, mitochondrial-like isoform X3 n=1 Tax=Montipora capricornis TaxID=246305 RepID=UPI0035F1775F